MSNYILKVTAATPLKLKAEPAINLPDTFKYQLEAGTQLPVASCGKYQEIHYRVAFGQDEQGNQVAFPGPEGTLRNTWLIFVGHCQLLNADGTPVRFPQDQGVLKLETFVGKSDKLLINAITAEKLLSAQIQERLISLALLDPPADGKFGPISIAALKNFQARVGLEQQDFLDGPTAEKLLRAKPVSNSQVNNFQISNSLASRVIQYMQRKNYKIFHGNQRYNIVYIEGMDLDGTLNNDKPNAFNDLRLVIEIVNGVPKLVGKWEATTEPGKKYTLKPMSVRGAARIKFGQYKAWQMGFHRRDKRHPALVQAGKIPVHRDLNKDYSRAGDLVEIGLFGVNQHHGYSASRNDVGGHSAGCLVGRSIEEHNQFIKLIKRDQRYLANRAYMFETTIIPGDELVKHFPPG
ncbi:peptidoglycan-binding domain-containing protein [Leptolyngbya sp. FACHB-671]|uniref:peptidoglycan-binding domain-containing protein n=1 Tax=Leptolyngbya sp. FACHB-671 TaxID=2692812 RepID=UPI001F54A015|nr:peptidoglycan-binding domain-containing protein [Leptolyngbya sp. FACHB-671]